MRLILLTALTMVAFAANSVINRAALAEGAIGPASFAAIRLMTGAIVLLIILWTQGALKDKPNIKPRLMPLLASPFMPSVFLLHIRF